MKRAGGIGLEASAMIAAATTRAMAMAVARAVVIAMGRAAVIAMGLAFVLGGGGCNSRPTCQNGWVYFDQVGSCVPPCEQSYGYEQCYGRDGGLQRSDAAAEAGDAGDAAGDGGGDGGAGDGDGSTLPCGAEAGMTGLPSIEPVAPQSGSFVAGPRPRFEWRLPLGADGADVTICGDRSLTAKCRTFPARGSMLDNVITFNAGVWYWRVQPTLRGMPVGCAGPVWQFVRERADGTATTSTGALLDVNGDSLADLVVTEARDIGYRSPVIRQYFGSSSGLRPGGPDLRVPTSLSSAYYGRTLLNAGDLDGDGFSDVLAVGLTDRDSLLVLYHGSNAGLLPEGREFRTYARFAEMLWGIAGVGDVDADGYADVVVLTVVGAPIVKTPASRQFRLDLLRGGSAREWPPLRTLLVTPVLATSESARVVPLGDVDGDGFMDIGVGTEDSISNRPELLVLYGARGGPSAGRMRIVRSSDTMLRHFGHAVVAQDVNGDGYSDLVISAQSVVDDRWQLQTFLGGPDGLAASSSGSVTQEPAAQAYVLGVRDVDSDGFEDVVFHTLSRDRRLVLYFGSAVGLQQASRVVLGPTIGTDPNEIFLAGHSRTGESRELAASVVDGDSRVLRQLAVSVSRSVNMSTDLRPTEPTAEFGLGVASSR